MAPSGSETHTLLGSVETEVMNPTAFANAPVAARAGRLGRMLAAGFTDKRSNVSRPKLIFTVSLVDALIVALTGIAAASLTGAGLDGFGFWPRALVVALAVMTLMHENWAYTISALRRIAGQAEKIVKSVVTVFCLVAGFSFLAKIQFFTPALATVWMLLALALLMASRFAIAALLDRLTRAGRLVRRTVIVGGGPEAEALISRLAREQGHGVEILGVFDDRTDERSAESFAGYAKLGNFEQLAAFCRNTGVDLLIVTVPSTAEQRLLQILGRLFTIPVDIRISALSSKLRLNPKAYSTIGGVPMLAVMDRPLTDWSRAVKNIEDRVIGTLLLVLAAPVMGLVALAIRLDSRGPVLFKQKRFGFNNELIEVLKFRTMQAEMSDANAATLATRDDPRVTRVGHVLRRASLDELPQLINVVRGEMSLVGPRPHATGAKADADLYQAVVDGYFARHRMKPGITGWAQVKGWRGETDTREKIEKRVEHDLAYIDNWSVLFDLYILALTPLAVLTGKNAH